MVLMVFRTYSIIKEEEEHLIFHIPLISSINGIYRQIGINLLKNLNKKKPQIAKKAVCGFFFNTLYINVKSVKMYRVHGG